MLAAEKQKLHSGYKAEREEMIALLMAKQNVDRNSAITDRLRKVTGATPGEEVKPVRFILAASPPKADANGVLGRGATRHARHGGQGDFPLRVSPDIYRGTARKT